MIKIIRLFGKSQVKISVGGEYIDHLTLHNQAVAIIDGGDTIGCLTLNDESAAEILSNNNLDWL